MSQDSGLVRRGLFLLALMGLLVAVLVLILFRTPDQPLPPPAPRPDLLAAGLVLPGASFPGAVAWPVLARMQNHLPSNQGWEIRYNAAAALARKGQGETPWPILLEMLNEDQQMRNFLVPLAEGKLVPDEAAARLTTISGLRAVAEWHKKQPEKITPSPDLLKVYAAVDKLAQSPIPDVKIQAEKTRAVLFR